MATNKQQSPNLRMPVESYKKKEEEEKKRFVILVVNECHMFIKF